jgi:RimJ/RimL family protein N-acetyltransferase
MGWEQTCDTVMSHCKHCGQSIETPDCGADELCEPCRALSEQATPVRITPMEAEDLELVLAWRSNPKIYRHFRRQDGPLDWKSHLSWYESRETSRHDFIIHYAGRRVGAVSITASEEISIYLGDFSAHGEGVATAALTWICERFAHRSPLIAEIHEENEASERLFEGCGFEQRDRDAEWIEYRYEP